MTFLGYMRKKCKSGKKYGHKKLTDMKPIVIAFSLLVLFTACSNDVAELKLDEVVEYLDARFKPDDPGAVVLVSSGNKILLNKAYGIASIEKSEQISPATIFAVGSITKQFTAISILKLQEQGKLNIRDTISLYLPGIPAAYSAITIEQLLSHTSGLIDVFDLPDIMNRLRQQLGKKEILTLLSDLSLGSEPGTSYRYSGFGYILLGYIIEEVSGESYAEYLTEEIFHPLDMKTAVYGYPPYDDLLANGYFQSEEGFFPAGEISLSLLFSAGGLFMSATDLHRWITGLRSGKVISRELLAKAWSPAHTSSKEELACGYGWDIKKEEGSFTIMHGGSMWGYDAFDLYFPDKEVYIICLTNSTGLNGPSSGDYAPSPIVFKIAEMLDLTLKQKS
jgi:CubicO group peptidase (beta-lactamase class C family)